MNINKNSGTAYGMFKSNLLKYKRYIFEGMGATIVINMLALATSLFSMQVYDRVIPTHGLSTLVTLAIGVIVMIIFEFSMKMARSSIMDNVIVGLDNTYSRQIYKRLLSIRLDQMPSSVGSLSSQLKGYETIRTFLTASTLYLFVDTPFAILYMLLLAFIGSPWIALISFSFFITALSVGLWLKHKIKSHATDSAKYNNIKVGELVETIQGSEIIKAGNGERKFLARWMHTSKGAISNDLSMRHINENSTYIAALLQQLGYASIIITGAFLVISGDMTMGALIACTIISGRIMAPVAALPGLFTQMAHAKAALEGLEQMYSLKTYHSEINNPLKPTVISGDYLISDVEYSYNEGTKALSIESFNINRGDKIAVVGSIGSGKSTLLKILSGMYIPQQGKILLDNLDISLIDRDILSSKIGYMTQDNRLFQGTLRENLIIGQKDPGDEILRDIATVTGLIQIIQSHPKGFELPISEGGIGLSTGQKQLVAITRLLINNPSIWLLDEPTASMDGQLENKVLKILSTTIKEEDTVIIVTHKPSILTIVDKIMVLNAGKIAMFGNKNEILAKLQSSIPNKEN
jgi:ATP-binding cassette, subfamily C, bacterial LapB